ncbi:DEAD/DEAH box helicase [Hymenobacter latericus]|uniref:DEAD/DEAH box helicase n=1 Tax=Hymenobacter sp. YIM 151858-1 TaxID=2987688 RepID=UPI002225D9EE|nr:DEAD/DEAH box helicase [Hymenobacter sp. YIM 151858-1]UYZ59882.1 DEAD/DEAH box helicase [Hymenobacter sp. YIM 151858-1]
MSDAPITPAPAAPDFDNLGLAEPLQRALQELGYTQPTAIQQQVVPLVLAGQDIAGQAPTGSGKTAAYGLPLLQKLDLQLDAVQAIVLVPARELALQGRDELKRLGKYLPGLRVAAFYGGHGFQEETKSLRQAPHVLVATPGRLFDHLDRRTFIPNKLQILVIDETDKLLELKFQEALANIVQRLPRRRQTLLFSATMPEKVLELVRRNLTRPRHVQAGAEGESLPESLTLLGQFGPAEKKPAALFHLLQKPETGRTLIFCNTRQRCEELARFLSSRGVAAEALHGKMPQPERDKALLKLRNGSALALVATDVAARGIDVQDLDTVVQFEVPDKADTFQHRAGRTARAGAAGTAYVLATPAEQQQVQRWQLPKAVRWQPLHAPALPPAEKTIRPTTVTLHVSAGRKEKVSAHDLVGALVNVAGLQREDVGRIEIFDHYSYITVPREAGKAVQQSMAGARIKGQKVRVTEVR